VACLEDVACPATRRVVHAMIRRPSGRILLFTDQIEHHCSTMCTVTAAPHAVSTTAQHHLHCRGTTAAPSALSRRRRMPAVGMRVAAQRSEHTNAVPSLIRHCRQSQRCPRLRNPIGLVSIYKPQGPRAHDQSAQLRAARLHT
jgi:hypothetical protein